LGRSPLVIPFQIIVSLKKSKSNWFLNDAIDIELTTSPNFVRLKIHSIFYQIIFLSFPDNFKKLSSLVIDSHIQRFGCVDCDQVRFSMFRQRDETFELLEQLWQISLGRILKWTEVEKHKEQSYETNQNYVVKSSPIKDILSESRRFYTVHFNSKQEQNSLQNDNHNVQETNLQNNDTSLHQIVGHNALVENHTHLNDNRENEHVAMENNNDQVIVSQSSSIGSIVKDIEEENRQFVSVQKYLLDTQRQNEHFQKTFRLPSTETLLLRGTQLLTQFFIISHFYKTFFDSKFNQC
jgi:hypothetical protein